MNSENIGIPIGNYLSQYFANVYLCYFDHWLKETKKVKYYFRYADDIVILHKDKKYLHELLNEIREYLTGELKLEIKNNYQIFPVNKRYIDFVGYCFNHDHIKVRKSTKKNLAKTLKYNRNKKSIASYNGWLNWCDSKHLKKKLLIN